MNDTEPTLAELEEQPASKGDVLRTIDVLTTVEVVLARVLARIDRLEQGLAHPYQEASER